jgi:hypothetical protein
MPIPRIFGVIAARYDRCAERTSAYSDRADRLNPKNVPSKRGSYQRRGQLTVNMVGSCILTLPRNEKYVLRAKMNEDRPRKAIPE